MATKAQITKYTQAALEAYRGAEFHGLFTSPMHAAHCVGLWMQETGRTAPRDCWTGRGDTFHCNDMLLRLTWTNVKHPTITRES